MIHEKLTNDDVFWNVRGQEQDYRRRLEADIRDLQGAIGLAEKALALRASPGWEPFLETVRAQLRIRTEELVLAKEDRETTLLQGRVRELRSVLALMDQAEAGLRTLEQRLRDRLQERENRIENDKVKPQGIVP